MRTPAGGRAARDTPGERSRPPVSRRSILKRYGFAWVTGLFFVAALAGHWLLAWYAFADEQAAHGLAADVGGYLLEVGRDTLENWQSEFLQLIWQVAGLALLLHVGSPQSKEGDDRIEAKVDEILRRVAPGAGERIIAELDEDYGGRQTDDALARREAERAAEHG